MPPGFDGFPSLASRLGLIGLNIPPNMFWLVAVFQPRDCCWPPAPWRNNELACWLWVFAPILCVGSPVLMKSKKTSFSSVYWSVTDCLSDCSICYRWEPIPPLLLDSPPCTAGSIPSKGTAPPTPPGYWRFCCALKPLECCKKFV